MTANPTIRFQELLAGNWKLYSMLPRAYRGGQRIPHDVLSRHLSAICAWLIEMESQGDPDAEELCRAIGRVQDVDVDLVARNIACA